MTFYTSDLHLGHQNIIGYENRPFTDINNMTEQIVQRWNSKVTDKDDVYILGDVAFISPKFTFQDLEQTLKKLKGKKHLIIGNHDDYIFKRDFNIKYYDEIVPYKELRENGKFICLCHYPIESWNKKHYGSIHLHGHIHLNPITPIENRYNVGCMLFDYYPVTLQEIIESQKKVEVKENEF